VDTFGAVALTGMTGATQATRWVGCTTSGPPTTGTFAVGDFITAQDGAAWVCYTAGTPGAWQVMGACLTATLAGGGLPPAAAGNKGMLGVLTDVGGGTLYRSDGAAWNAVGAGAGWGNPALTTKGDLLTYATSLARQPVGAGGQLLMPDSGVTNGLAWVTPNYSSITGALAETIPFRLGASAVVAMGTTGQMRLVLIWLPSRITVTSISFVAGSTGMTGGTHGYAALYRADTLALLRQSTDDTATTWTASTVKPYTLSSTFVTTFAGWYYLGLCLTASGLPTLTGFAGSGTLNALAVISSATATGAASTAPNPVASLVGVGGIPYAYVS
jgi:hypothetical protein